MPRPGSVSARLAWGDVVSFNMLSKVLKMLSILGRQGTPKPMRAHLQLPDTYCYYYYYVPLLSVILIITITIIITIIIIINIVIIIHTLLHLQPPDAGLEGEPGCAARARAADARGVPPMTLSISSC